MNCFGKLKQDYLIALKEASRVGADRCEFNDECNKCNNAELGSFSYGGDGWGEVDGYICGKCLLKARKKIKRIKKCTEDTVVEKGLFDE